MIQRKINSICECMGKLGIIAMRGCEELAGRIDHYLVEAKKRQDKEEGKEHSDARKTYLLEAECPRFSDGQGKGIIKDSIRGYDVFIICDVLNYGVTFKMYGMEVPMSPDNHFQDLKRIISAIGGKAKRITVIMPYLYEERQDCKKKRESLDCALALQELMQMGVSNIIVFDAHETRVQNAIPLIGFDNLQPHYQMVKALTRNVPDITFDKESCIIMSPDEGAMPRCAEYANMLGLDLGTFYKVRDHSRIVDGGNPILEHKFLECDVEGKDIIIPDDILASGSSLLGVAKQLKARGANRIFLFATFGQFTEGLEAFDDAYSREIIERVFTTNLIYRKPELKTRNWYVEVDMSKYLYMIIDSVNKDTSIHYLLDPATKIMDLLQATSV